ncbi:PEP-CTERM sorting domain-containing protein [Thalassomonas haliotis]|uniref:PEP-CTERM sorting domain-containing protein n=1 Tax=Thalassomonas haliotis TaxID=485448 RepID=A0ABY7VK59_9GAMM|nr:PEP-CTERM sorting domain-containing protein [Thalassomonas haliotis]WDE13047.1 PEP-CTERM sorting domain-containing protein [Thalassomonas haliotis]
MAAIYLPFACFTKTAKVALTAIVLSMYSMINLAHGGIIDTNNNSFIDDATNLEWMDFGINNQYSYNEISNMLDAGDLYQGWRLATENELTGLFINAFYYDADSWTDYRGTQIPAVFQARASHKDEDTGLYKASAFEQIFDAMSFNGSNNTGTMFTSWGLYRTNKGQLDILYAVDFRSGADNSDNVILYNGRDLDADENYFVYSTMLVRDAQLTGTEVSEPGSLAILALGIMGLAMRNVKKR